MLLVSTGPVVDDILVVDTEALVPLPVEGTEDKMGTVFDEEKPMLDEPESLVLPGNDKILSTGVSHGTHPCLLFV